MLDMEAAPAILVESPQRQRLPKAGLPLVDWELLGIIYLYPKEPRLRGQGTIRPSFESSNRCLRIYRNGQVTLLRAETGWPNEAQPASRRLGSCRLSCRGRPGCTSVIAAQQPGTVCSGIDHAGVLRIVGQVKDPLGAGGG